MKKILFLFLLIAQQSFSQDTILVTNPGNGNDIRANLATAIGLAVDGNIVLVPTCSVIITPPTITVTKKIKIFGTDSLNTIIIRSEAQSDASILNVPMITFDGSAWTLASSGVMVKGITFKSKIPATDDIGSDGSLALDQGLSFINVSGFEVKECGFKYFGNGAIRVDHRDYFSRGLIHKNNFYLSGKGLSGLGYGYGVVLYGENLQWIPYVNSSDGNKIFIENNTFTWQSHAIAAGGCARYASRDNNIYKNVMSDNVSKHAIDGHGQELGTLGSENYFSTRIMISYLDTIINDIFFDRTPYISNGTTLLNRVMERAILSRGGEIIVDSTYVIGYRFAWGISTDGGAGNYPYLFGAGYKSGLTYPSTHTGTTSSLGAGDAFGYDISYSVYDASNGDGTTFNNYRTSDFTVNRDYHSVAKPGYVNFTYPYPYTY